MGESADPALPERLVLEPIGYVHAAATTRVQAARQPRAAQGVPARIELLPGRHFEHALADLARWERIWVLFWFHRNPGWRPKVLPPRSTTGRKGVFSTRSPHRPNPIGLSVVRLERIEGLVLHVRDADMLEGTPVLDLKPYVAYTDAHPQAGDGWLADQPPAGTPPDPVPAYDIRFAPLAQQQVEWIETHAGLALGERVRATLTLGPQPHPYRRIRREPAGLQLAVKEWRVRFRVEGRVVHVTAVDSGYRPAQLTPARADPALGVHRAFIDRWPRGLAG
ncbi:MAG: tRNA (N6-threonylcarbamoyladenosine(37)-N6)-methyltransferase TrmO [Proteobacteria bacterium]|nr:tRNA (N6-threonylcarbamoyladenosine(37)-N6)-methyltransferase TrmO [Pseudomonadota bacterium]